MIKREALSVIVPLYKDSTIFRESLESIVQSDYPFFEVLVVDDSIDGIDADSLPPVVKVIRTDGGVGPASGRNIGARESVNDILVFIDSDVVIKRNTLSRLVETMEREGPAGVVAIQSPVIRYSNFASVYKNVFLYYSFKRIAGQAPSFYTCCAMIRKRVFLCVGGFDERYRRPAIEDTDMGHKLAAAGAKIVVGAEIEVEHVKRYSLSGLVVLDFKRAAGLVRLFLRRSCLRLGSSSTSVPMGFIASGSLSIGIFLFFILFMVYPKSYYVALFLTCWLGLIACNRGLIGGGRRNYGLGYAVKSILFLPVDLLVSAVGSLWGVITFLGGKRY